MKVVQNGHYSSSFRTNIDVSQGSIPATTLFLIPISNFPGDISSQLAIYVDVI